MGSPTPMTGPTVAEQPLEFTRLLYMLSQDMDNLTRHADTKAQIILAINAILTAAAGQAATQVGTGLRVAVFGFGVVTLVLMIGSVYFSLRTVLPRNVQPHAGGQRNLFFYEDIRSLGVEEFLQRFLGQTMPDVRAAILQQVYAKSHVVDAKFRNVRRAVTLLFWAVLFWLLGRILATAT